MKDLSPKAQQLWDKYGDALGEFEVASQVRGKVGEDARNAACRRYLATIREFHDYIVGLEELAPAPGRLVISITLDGNGLTLVQDGDEVTEEASEFATKMHGELLNWLTAVNAPDATGTPS